VSKSTDDTEDQIAGISKSDYNQSAKEYSKNQIMLWLVAGVVYSIYAGSLISVTTILLFLPGIFIISLASIPFFLLRIKKVKTIQSMSGTNTSSQIPTLIFFTITSIIGFLFPIASSVLFVYLLNGLFK